MTLQNLKYALYLNNLILLNKIQSIEDLVSNGYIHNNIDVLSNLSDLDGMLIYNGEPVSPVITEEQIQQAITDTIKLLKEEET